MSDWPHSATRHAKAAVLAEARRRGLIAPDGGDVWIYMFHDMYGVAHFRHIDFRGYMQMLPDEKTHSTSREDQGADTLNDNDNDQGGGTEP